MAYVAIQHLSPQHHSILPDLLRHYTDIPVKVAENNMRVKPDPIYVIPENVMLGIFHGQLRLLGPTANMKVRLSVDYFFRSLAHDLRDGATAVVLSATGSDGSLGLKAVKEAGGLVVAQDPTTTVYDGMPRSAIATGMVDFILPPGEILQKLVDYWHLIPTLSQLSIAMQRPKPMPDELQQILHMIRAHTGHDFSYYKQSTITRRIERLMAINHVESLADYVSYLINNPMGVEALFRDLLIGVTNFFRNKEVFQTLKDSVIPQLFVDHPADQPIRIWVPACSTGEEAYSITILIQEHITALRTQVRVQIFATDLDVHAINVARSGEYPPNIEGDVPDEYLRQYFVPTDHGYKIAKVLRDMLVFSVHSVIKGPPFSRLDFISCRNLLIYMEAELQQRVLSLFHFALNSRGFLLLGSSESVGQAESEFTIIHSQHKIFQQESGGSTARFKPEIPPLVTHMERRELLSAPPHTSGTLRTFTETRLLAHWTPTCVIINHQGHIRYLQGL